MAKKKYDMGFSAQIYLDVNFTFPSCVKFIMHWCNH